MLVLILFDKVGLFRCVGFDTVCVSDKFVADWFGFWFIYLVFKLLILMCWVCLIVLNSYMFDLTFVVRVLDW